MTTTLFHSLTFADVPAAIEFLEAVGFTKRGVYADDAGVVVHAQYDWGDSGGIMFGAKRSDRASGNPDGFVDSTGHSQCYCVVGTDAEVDEVYARAMAAGATSVRQPEDEDYGGRGCTVRDREGNQWSFGSYPGE
ncbi:MAG TPA: VOC family protein [Nocardioides sp.]|jgi:uncharacterized glyoxalase superfamily protein PhnB